MVVSAIPSLVAAVYIYFLFPESPYYLAVSGRHDELKEMLQQIADKNGKPKFFDDHYLDTSKSVISNERGNLSQLFKDGMAKISIPIALIWLLVLLCYYGSILSATSIMVSSKEHITQLKDTAVCSIIPCK